MKLEARFEMFTTADLARAIEERKTRITKATSEIKALEKLLKRRQGAAAA